MNAHHAVKQLKTGNALIFPASEGVQEAEQLSMDLDALGIPYFWKQTEDSFQIIPDDDWLWEIACASLRKAMKDPRIRALYEMDEDDPDPSDFFGIHEALRRVA